MHHAQAASRFTQPTSPEGLQFQPASPDDLAVLTELRLAAMRPSLEAIGRYNPDRVRQRLAESWDPAHTVLALQAGQLAGFFTWRETPAELWLNHLYIHPEHQSAGIGRAVIAWVQGLAARQAKPLLLHALRESPANRFYQFRGFVRVADLEWDHLYEWLPPGMEPSLPRARQVVLRQVTRDQDKSRLCQETLATLPDWFGIPESTAAYVRDVASRTVHAILWQDTEAGFISLQGSSTLAEEIHVIGLKPEYHRRGLGSLALRYLAAEARLKGLRYWCVKTLAESAHSPEYDRTRAFYSKNGFDPLLVEPTLWDAANPCLIMVRCL